MATAATTAGSSSTTAGNASGATASKPSPTASAPGAGSSAIVAHAKNLREQVARGLGDEGDVIPFESGAATSQDHGQADPSAANADRQPANAGSDAGAGETSTTETSEAGAAEGQPSVKQGETQENTPQAGDEIVAELDQLGREFGAPDAANQNGDASDKQAAAGSDGEPASTEAEAKELLQGESWTPEQQAKARSFIGKQGRELGEHRKAFRQISQFIAPDAKGNLTFNLDKIVAQMGDEAVSQFLSKQGLKVVPMGAELNQADPVDTDLKELVNQMVPGEELTYEEKLAEINGDVKRSLKLRQELESRNQQRTQKQQESVRQKEATANAFLGELQKLKHWPELKPALRYWNKELPETPGFEGQQRLRVLKLLAEASRFPTLAKRLQQTVRESVTKEWESKYGMTAVPGGGENPTYVPGGDDGKGQASAKANQVRKQFEVL